MQQAGKMTTGINMDAIRDVREKLNRTFDHDTAYPGSKPWPRSTGHCAAVAVIVHRLFGGKMMSATVAGTSHWFNRIGGHDVDLTADQFGFAAVTILPVGKAYSGAQERFGVNDETQARSDLLAARAGLG